jgi:hypothetical protein
MILPGRSGQRHPLVGKIMGDGVLHFLLSPPPAFQNNAPEHH